MTTDLQKPYPTGFELIYEKLCPLKRVHSWACVLCPFGHVTECHYPNDCRTAECAHYLVQINTEVEL